MPSRLPPSPSPRPPPTPTDHHQIRLVPPLAVAFSFLVVLSLCFRKFATRKRTAPSDAKPPHKFSYTALRRATSSFSPSNRLGQGGFGSVYRGTLINNQDVAVKVMDAGSLQGEREFQNELFFAGKIDSDRILSVVGFSSDRRRRRMVLVYELMTNGSLQDCLLHRKCAELKEWKNRLSVAIDIAKGIEYLHHYCDPPIIHGDIKPSNILLDHNFNAKIGDFGLARLKPEDEGRVELNSKIEEGRKVGNSIMEDNGSVFEETESLATTTVCEEFSVAPDNQSPESFVTVAIAETSPETIPPSPRMAAARDVSVSEGNLDAISLESGGGGSVKKSGRRKKSMSGKDWWWKQDNGMSESGRVKDYVMEWIGSEIKKERPKTEWITTGASSSAGQTGKSEKKNKKRLDWWISLDEDKNVKKQKRRPAREWWKEEYCDELARKKKKNKKKQGKDSTNDNINNDNWWPKDDEIYVDRKKKRSRSRGSRGSVDWWLDGFSGELWRARHNSHDSVSGEIPRSGGISSTPSMRGTVCYVAPEYSCGGDLSEKCDVYSFGVLLLVLIAGRRPLQVTGSPMSEFQRANLLSWARHLARAGKLLELVDQSIQCLDREQALVCIIVALLCLQKSPALRPSMKEVVAMLSGDLEPPPLPVEYSPSPPSRFRSHRKVR
ncbi:receptor-like serine/threonine-protein kinase At4g25390 [Cynara cardunculus var. scolymus]|uniref:receptor-like serine/threonine-protein kinase At4g25390 n=1 Tax=Cynara cardunculus var. scolymus TaxID=59895 RepID=UPI000D62FB16|nr:receptor-like serine/threonine-protein kinase At4g25390 [Cynara cardunculus var. scolymus]